jgi:hypothetical protein
MFSVITTVVYLLFSQRFPLNPNLHLQTYSAALTCKQYPPFKHGEDKHPGHKISYKRTVVTSKMPKKSRGYVMTAAQLK